MMRINDAIVRIARKIVAQYEYPYTSTRMGMSRGYFIVDENLLALEGPLRARNFHVIVPQAGETDDSIIKRLLGHRVLLTENVGDFMDAAPVHEFSIVSLKELRFIDPDSSDKNITAKLIADAWKNFDLGSKPHPWLLTLKDNGKHSLRRIS